MGLKQWIVSIPAAAAGIMLATALASAAESGSRLDPLERELEVLTVIGKRHGVEEVAGSAYLISDERLKQFEYSDPIRVLREVPGLYLTEEDGLGLRPNIGLRGSGTDRSSRIALLEDGVLIAPAPYASPSAYYFPPIRRMSSVEVLKGPASIKVGPRTTGGAINFRSRPIPDDTSVFLSALVGPDGARDLYGWVGGTSGQFGFLVETVQQQYDGFKELVVDGVELDTGFDTSDYTVKLRYASPDNAAYYQGVELKLGYTEHEANETYLGLTEEDFAVNPFRRYPGSQLDNIETEHKQYQLTYFLEPSEGSWDLSLTAYNNRFERNWFKLRQINGVGISSILDDPGFYATEYRYLLGNDSPDDALSNRNNKRSYNSRGLQGQLGVDLEFSSFDFRNIFGFRIHEDEEDRFQDDDEFRMENGRMVLTTDGPPGSATNRVSDAFVTAVFWSGDIVVGKWHIEPGLRWENIGMSRHDYDTADPQRINGPASTRETAISVLIPGVGLLYDIDDRWAALAGVHKGFNPSASGSNSDEETSINYEAGFRYRNHAAYAEVIGFYNDYENLVGTVTGSTGGDLEIGEQHDSGKTTVAGLEIAAGYEFDDPLGGGVSFPMQISYTSTAKAEFETSFESDYEPWGTVEAGDSLPYLPENQFQVSFGATADQWSIHVNGNYSDKMRTIAGSGPIAAAESTDSYLVWDVAGKYWVNDKLNLVLKVDNLLDEEYLVARRPAGLRPGRDRQVMLGVQLEF